MKISIQLVIRYLSNVVEQEFIDKILKPSSQKRKDQLKFRYLFICCLLNM